MTADQPRSAPGRPPGLPLGRVLGVPVFLRYSWLLLAIVVVLLYSQVVAQMLPRLTAAGQYAFAVGFVLCLLLSVLLHEIGHAVVARHYGIRVRAITLEMLGGYTEMETDSPHARADFAVSAVGPIVSGVLGLVALGGYAALPPATVVSQLAFQLAWSNIIVAVFNALPGLPLDGGRALRAIVWGVTGNRHRATTVAGWTGRALAGGLLLFGFGLAATTEVGLTTVLLLTFVALTMWQGATGAIMQAQLLDRLARVTPRQVTRPIFAVPSGTPLAEAVRRRSESGVSDPALAVTDRDGRLLALVHEESAAAVPADRRPWVPVDSVAQAIDAHRTLDADLTGEAILKALQAGRASTYLVVSGSDVVGVLRTADLAKALRS
jgi:Zn-dependent protease